MSKLTGKGVLITRPTSQATKLTDMVTESGATPYLFPVIEIQPTTNIDLAHKLVMNIDLFDIAIFISINAVERGIALLKEHGDIPEKLLLAAVGLSSAKALLALGLKADIIPEQQYDSEGLLATSELQSVNGKRIIIFRGEGGREVLAQGLTHRGAVVEYAEVYKRAIPCINPQPLIDDWQQNCIDFVVVTSSAGLNNLVTMLGDDGWSLLKNSQLVTVSQRVADLAKKMGIIKPAVITEKPSDEAIIASLKTI